MLRRSLSEVLLYAGAKAEVARTLGVNRAYPTLWGANPPPEHRDRICDALEAKFGILITDREPAPRTEAA